MPRMPNALIEAARERDEIKSWLVRHAYPLWWERGADRTHGGFHEALSLNAEPLAVPRRSRVQPRQIYAFSVAGALGWSGPFRQAVEHGLQFQLAKYRREDGLFCALVAADGSPLDARATLYDQAFALLGLASAYAVLADRNDLKTMAVELRERMHEELQQPGSLEQGAPHAATVSSNAYMHLFEACLAWHEADGHPAWLVMADEIVRLAMTRFFDPNLGAVREYFDGDWNPPPDIEGRIIEPGHQFEWAWLLLRWAARAECDEAVDVAMRLIQTGEAHGVDKERRVAMNALLDDFSVHDATARLWPQTERVKATCVAAVATGEEKFWGMAVEGLRGLRRFLDAPTIGLWRDRMNTDGSFVTEPVPASSFYHIVCAIAELDRAIMARAQL